MINYQSNTTYIFPMGTCELPTWKGFAG